MILSLESGTMPDTKERRAITHNTKIHDAIASQYDSKHREIYNPREQLRIAGALRQAFASVETGSKNMLVLDYGAGTGNLTSHLLDLPVDVIAADVSSRSLQRLLDKQGSSKRLKTCTLNGRDLSNVADNTLDLAATYSVLHHVPNYLKIVDEFVRVVKPGGVIYIDHEACPSYWNADTTYQRYLEELGESFRQAYLLIMELPDDRKGRIANLVTRLKRALARGKASGLLLRRLKLLYDEGDIHNSKKDHIEWDEIRARLVPSCEVLLEESYLVCREEDDAAPVWLKWRDKTADMRMIVARKSAVPQEVTR
jgi:ubiquinone/menaquinone biosynthesis C-methylase UbiE